VAVESIGESIRNPVTFDYLHRVKQLQCLGYLRYLNLGVIGIVWRHDSPDYLKTYSAICPYLKPDWRFFHTRIVDVGLFGHWVDLEACMKDYDINPSEWDEADNHQIRFRDNLPHNRIQQS